jgi:hypothetical protein
MRMLLKILVGVAIVALWVWLKYSQTKSAYARDLGNGGIQKLFDDDSK